MAPLYRLLTSIVIFQTFNNSYQKTTLLIQTPFAWDHWVYSNFFVLN